jgi:hypothetical protein
MSQRSPSNLNTPRNLALAKGVEPYKLAEPDMQGCQPIPPAPEVSRGSSVSPARGQAFVVRGGG